MPNRDRPILSRSSSESTRYDCTSPSAATYRCDSPSSRGEMCMDCSMREMSVARACRADGRNCGSGWRARNACSQAYSETHTQDTYDNMWPRASDVLMLNQRDGHPRTNSRRSFTTPDTASLTGICSLILRRPVKMSSIPCMELIALRYCIMGFCPRQAGGGGGIN